MTLQRSKPIQWKPRPKTCRSCRDRFTPVRPGQVVCSPRCAIEHQRAQKERADRANRAERKRKTRQQLEALKTQGELMKEAQAAFNEWIRERDHGLPCISCGRHHNGKWDAGHYRTVGACPELRFEPLNVHRQCSPCNTHLSGNLIEYRVGLIARIGEASVEWLEGPHPPKRYTREQLRGMKREYRKRARDLRKRRAAA